MTKNSTKKRSAASRRNQPTSTIPWLWIGLGVAAVVVIGIIIYLGTRPQPAAIEGVESFSNLTRNHVNGTVSYPQAPPVGGDHAPVWQNCGIYDQPIQNETGVHSMEHGAVWITYQPDLPADQLTLLKQLAGGHRYVLMSPYQGLPTPVVVTAWGVQLKAQTASDPRLAQFISRYEQGPQTQEPGAPCSGGVGSLTG